MWWYRQNKRSDDGDDKAVQSDPDTLEEAFFDTCCFFVFTDSSPPSIGACSFCTTSSTGSVGSAERERREKETHAPGVLDHATAVLARRARVGLLELLILLLHAL